MAYYPLYFLPFFWQKTQSDFSYWRKIEIIAVVMILILSVYLRGYLAISLYAAYLLGLVLLPYFGFLPTLRSRLLLLLCPPFVQKYSLVIGFPLRLHFTEQAVNILQIFGWQISNQGNRIFTKTGYYNVDPECEGLKMLSALLLILFLFYRNMAYKKRWLQILVIITAVMLWFLANLIRIVVLIFATIPPDSIAHSLIGILLFLAIPAFSLFLLSIIWPPPKTKNNYQKTRPIFYPAFFLLAILYLCQILPQHKEQPVPAFPDSMGDWQREIISDDHFLNHEIASYRKGNIRWIIKRTTDLFRVSHHPRHCWRGSGYRFLWEENFRLNTNQHIKRAFIQKNTEKPMQLLWWYESNGQRIGSELEWRWKSLSKNQLFIQNNLILPAQENPMPWLVELAKIIDR